MWSVVFRIVATDALATEQLRPSASAILTKCLLYHRKFLRRGYLRWIHLGSKIQLRLITLSSQVYLLLYFLLFKNLKKLNPTQRELIRYECKWVLQEFNMTKFNLLGDGSFPHDKYYRTSFPETVVQFLQAKYPTPTSQKYHKLPGEVITIISEGK